MNRKVMLVAALGGAFVLFMFLRGRGGSDGA